MLKINIIMARCFIRGDISRGSMGDGLSLRFLSGNKFCKTKHFWQNRVALNKLC